MKKFLTAASFFFAVLFFFSGCGSVKENRLQCPLYVYFNNGVNAHGCTSSADVRIVRDGSSSLCGVFPMDEFAAPLFSVVTQRGENCCSALCGADPMGENVIFRTEEAVGEVYALCESFVAGTEDMEYVVKDTLRRQTAPVTLAVKGFPDDGGGLQMRVHSNWAGFNMFSLESLKGDYWFTVDFSENGRTLFCLPRQGDDTLRLEFLRDGESVGGCALGESIIRSGYDWTAGHLEPIDIDIKLSVMTLAVAVNGWSEQVLIDYRI